MATETEALERIRGLVRLFGTAEQYRELTVRLDRILREVDDAKPADEADAADRAVRALLEHDGRTVTAWAIAADVERLDGLLLEQGIDFALSPEVSPTHALGLAEALAGRLRGTVRRAFAGE